MNLRQMKTVLGLEDTRGMRKKEIENKDGKHRGYRRDGGSVES